MAAGSYGHVTLKRFDMDYAGIARCAVGPELRHAVAEVSGFAYDYAQLIAPHDLPEYQAGFHHSVEIIPDIPNRQRGDPPMARWAGIVSNDSSIAVVVEVGAYRNASFTYRGIKEHRVFRRTLEWLELVA